MAKYLDENGVLYLWGKVKTYVTNAINTIEKYTHPTYTAKSSGFYKVTVDGTGHVSATSAVTKADITDLGIPAQDTVYTHPTHTAKESGLYKVTVDAKGHVSAATAVAKSDITALGIPSKDTTYSAATSSADGLMAKADKAKLDAFGAASTYALKSDIANMYKYKGTVANASNLPTSGVEVGWVYNITNSSEYGGAGMNVVWTGNAWDPLGEIFSITSITNAEIDTICV